MARRVRPTPGQEAVGEEGAGEAEFGVSGENERGPAVDLLGVADARGMPAAGLPGEVKGVLGVEAAVRLPRLHTSWQSCDAVAGIAGSILAS